MPDPRRLRSAVLLAVLLPATVGLPGPTLARTAVAPAPQVMAAIPAWDGSVDLYRRGVFTTQKTWLWCTAAGVQIVRNIVERHR